MNATCWFFYMNECRPWFNLLTLAANWSILSYYWCLIIQRWLYCLLVMIDDQIETYEGYEYTPLMDWNSLSPMRQFISNSRHLQMWSGLFCFSDAVFLHRLICLSREMFQLDLLGRCMGIGGCSHLFVPLYPHPKELGGQFDNAGTLGGCFSSITFPEAD